MAGVVFYLWMGLLLAGTATSSSLGVKAWQRRSVPGGSYFALMMAGVAIWSALYALEAMVPGIPAKVDMAKAEYLGIAFVPVFWVLFSLAYTGFSALARRIRVPLLVLPAVTLVLAMTSDLHHLLWSGFFLETSDSWTPLTMEHGPWFWVHVFYSYALFLVGTVLLVRSARRYPQRYQLQALSIIGAAVLPWIGNAAYLLRLVPDRDLDPTPLAFAASGCLLGWALLRFRFLERPLGLHPAARRAMMETLQTAVLVLDADDQVVDVNPTAAGILSCCRDDILGRSLESVLDGLRAPSGSTTAMVGPEDIQLLGEGGRRTYELVRSPFGQSGAESQGTLLLLRDITERKQAEEELRETVQWLHESQHFAQLGHYVYDVEGDQWNGSPSLYQVFGVDEDYVRDFAGWLDLVHPGDRARVSRHFTEEVLGKREPFDLQYRVVRPRDRIERWVHGRGNLEVRSDGQVVSMFGVIQDVTHTKQAEQILKTSERRFVDIAEHTQEWIWEVDTDGRYTYSSQAVEKILGYTPEEILQLHFYELYPLGERESLKAAALATISNKETLLQNVNRNVHKNGQLVWLCTSALPMLDDQGNVLGYRGVDTDITERKQAEEDLRQRLTELEALHLVSGALPTAQTRDDALQILFRRTLAALETDTGAIWLYHPESDDLRVAVSGGWFESLALTPTRPGENFVGGVFARGQTHISAEMARDPLLGRPGRSVTPDGWGGICVPLRAGETTIGVLIVSTPPGRRITTHQVALLESLAEMGGAALHRMSLYEATVRQLDRLRAMHEVDQAISSGTDLPTTLKILLEHVAAQLQVDAADVLLLDSGTLTLSPAAGRGFRAGVVETLPIRVGEGLAGRAALERRAVHTDDPAEMREGLKLTAFPAREGFVAYHAVPLIAKGQVVGVLEVFHRAPLTAGPDWLRLLEALAGQAAIAIENAQLFEGLQRSNLDLALAYDATIEGWSHALDLRDKETEGHTQRVTEMTVRLARAMGIGDAELVHVRRGALLHDIGKMGVPDSILLKPGPLTEEEWVLMRQHPLFAYDLLSPIAYLRPALDIPYCHHERWDGTGYPRGLKGEEIPLTARLFAVVDVWDALRSHRPYRGAWWPDEKVLEHIRSSAGTHFDPEVVEIFLLSASQGTGQRQAAGGGKRSKNESIDPLGSRNLFVARAK